MQTELIFTYISHVTAMDDIDPQLMNDLEKAGTRSLEPLRQALETGRYFISDISSCTAVIQGAVIHYTTAVLTPVSMSEKISGEEHGISIKEVEIGDLPDQVRKAIEKKIGEIQRDEEFSIKKSNIKQ